MANSAPITTDSGIEGASIDRRRAYDAKMNALGLKRVSVLVPIEHTDIVKSLARQLRTTKPESADD